MLGDREEIKKRIAAIIEKFRQKGAISPDKAMSVEELGLPPRFKEAMHRILGQSGIFAEVNGKYYLNEERLKLIQDKRTKSGYENNEGNQWNRERQPGWIRYAGILLMVPIGLIIAVGLVYFFSLNGGVVYFPGEFLVIILVVSLCLFVARLLFWRSRRKYWRKQY
jgi:hypothetical protein